MENNNNNGRGIFYGVIGVATLVVAIIGATFAYFSATVTQNNAINIASTNVRLDIIDQKSNFKTNLIPVDTLDTVNLDEDENPVPNTAFYRYPGLTPTGQGAGTCVDNVGNSICSVYEITIQNPTSSAAQTIVGSLTPTTNSGFTNLQYAVFKGAASTISSYDVNADPVSTTAVGAAGKLVHKGTIGTIGTPDVWENTEERLASGGTTTYTVVVWLEDTGAAQDTEQGKLFAAAVTFKSPEGEGVTGVITTS